MVTQAQDGREIWCSVHESSTYTSIINGLNKSMGWEKPIKRAGPIAQGTVKNQLEIVEAKKHHSFLTDAVYTLHCLWNIPDWHNKNYWTLQPVKLGGHNNSQTRKWSQMMYYFIFLPLFLLFHMPTKVPDLKTYIHFNKEFFPTRRNFQSNMENFSWTSPTGHYDWLSSVLYNTH